MFITKSRHNRELYNLQHDLDAANIQLQNAKRKEEDLNAEISDLTDEADYLQDLLEAYSSDNESFVEALVAIIGQRTAGANATVTRMANIAEATLESMGLGPDGLPMALEPLEFQPLKLDITPTFEGTLADLRREIENAFTVGANDTTVTTSRTVNNSEVTFDWTGLDNDKTTH